MSRIIPLTQGKAAFVDEIDFDWISSSKWYANRTPDGLWYARRDAYCGSARHSLFMHREIGGKIGYPLVDHWDHDGLNNQRFNLRPCNQTQNSANSRKQPGCSSRFKGVSWDRVNCRWESYIRINHIRHRIGRFDDEVEAALAYNEAAKKLFGEFAFLNQI